MCPHQLGVGGGLERWSAQQHIEKAAAERVEVGSRFGRGAVQQAFRRGEGGRARQPPSLDGPPARDPCSPHPKAPVLEEQAVGADIPMDDPREGRGVEAKGRLLRKCRGSLRGKRSALGHQVGKRASLGPG